MFSTLRMNRIMLTWIVCVLALAAFLGWAGGGIRGRDEMADTGSALIKADFELQTANGKTVRSADLAGSYLLVYFGFTHCPDVCPTTLLLMNNAIRDMGKASAKVKPVFITLDPERDSPDKTAAYVSHFGEGILGLSGSTAQIKHAAESFKVYYSKVEMEGSALEYVIDHSSFIYLMSPKGEYVAHFASNIAEQELKKELQRYVR